MCLRFGFFSPFMQHNFSEGQANRVTNVGAISSDQTTANTVPTPFFRFGVGLYIALYLDGYNGLLPLWKLKDNGIA
jgi:hypothetical protein